MSRYSLNNIYYGITNDSTILYFLHLFGKLWNCFCLYQNLEKNEIHHLCFLLEKCTKDTLLLNLSK